MDDEELKKVLLSIVGELMVHRGALCDVKGDIKIKKLIKRIDLTIASAWEIRWKLKNCVDV